MSPDRGMILRAWTEARIGVLRLKTRDDVLRRQARLWKRFQPVVARTPALTDFAGLPHREFPVTTPTQVRADFAGWNTLGLDAASARAAAETAEGGGESGLPGGVTAGFSTGTQGARGLFLTSPAERANYLGQALARLLPAHAPFRRWRIALCLRANSALYHDVVQAGLIAFDFIGLDVPADVRRARLDTFRPHILIAPSHVLAELAHGQMGSNPWPLTRLFYGAEPMGEAERAWIESRLGRRPDPIYQATEGFLGAACRFGTLHLNEDVMIVERDPVPGTNRFCPIVTDLRRTSQPIVRLRLDDLLESAPPCRCGSPLQAVKGVEGRVADIWCLGDRVVPPRVVEDTITAALGPAREWRATASASRIVIEAEPDVVEAAASAITGLVGDLDRPVVRKAARPTQDGPKRGRVRWIP